MVKRKYLLPDGKTTTSTTKYVKEWRELGKPFCELVGVKIYAFDPDIQFSGGGGERDMWGNNVITLPVEVLKRINKSLEEMKR